MGDGTDQDLPWSRGLLEAGGEVDGLAGRERRLAVVDHDLAGLEPDAHGESQLLDRGENGDRSPGGPLGVVLVRLRDTERSHHGIACELLHDTAVGGHALGYTLEVARHTTPHDLWIGTREELGGADQIDEENSRQLSLHT